MKYGCVSNRFGRWNKILDNSLKHCLWARLCIFLNKKGLKLVSFINFLLTLNFIEILLTKVDINEEDGWFSFYILLYYRWYEFHGFCIFFFSIMEAVAKHEFVATADDELSFPRGARLKVITCISCSNGFTFRCMTLTILYIILNISFTDSQYGRRS